LHNEDGVIIVLDDREWALRPLRKGGKDITKHAFSINDTLKQVSSNCKEEGGKRIPYLTPLLHKKSFPPVPLRSTKEVVVDNRSLIHLSHLGGKPLASSISRTAECSMRSKAFSKSNLRIIIPLLD
jgi:hypothetical protein